MLCVWEAAGCVFIIVRCLVTSERDGAIHGVREAKCSATEIREFAGSVSDRRPWSPAGAVSRFSGETVDAVTRKLCDVLHHQLAKVGVPPPVGYPLRLAHLRHLSLMRESGAFELPYP